MQPRPKMQYEVRRSCRMLPTVKPPMVFTAPPYLPATSRSRNRERERVAGGFEKPKGKKGKIRVRKKERKNEEKGKPQGQKGEKCLACLGTCCQANCGDVRQGKEGCTVNLSGFSLSLPPFLDLRVLFLEYRKRERERLGPRIFRISLKMVL